VGSNPAENDGFLRAIEIHSATFFGEEEDALRFCSVLKNPRSMKRDTYRQNYGHF
jgi:hypothetical protein